MDKHQEEIDLSEKDIKNGTEEVYHEFTKEDDTVDTTIEKTRSCTIAESIIQSCKEIKLMREGKLPKRSWEDFAQKIREEIEEDENQ